jgi:hypothetical protein
MASAGSVVAGRGAGKLPDSRAHSSGGPSELGKLRHALDGDLADLNRQLRRQQLAPVTAGPAGPTD